MGQQVIDALSKKQLGCITPLRGVMMHSGDLYVLKQYAGESLILN